MSNDMDATSGGRMFASPALSKDYCQSLLSTGYG